MLSTRTLRVFKNSGISTSSISLSHISTSNSESSLRVIALPSLVYPYFELDIEQDKIANPG